jgi:hypothetical protein
MWACSFDVIFDASFFGFGHSLVEKQRCSAKISELFWGYSQFLSLLPLSVDVVSGLDSEGILFDKLEKYRYIVDFEIATKEGLFVEKLFFFVFCPF